MTRQSDLFDGRIADWLEADPDQAPDQVLEVVLAAFPSIRQRRRGLAIGGGRTFPMTSTFKLALGAGAVLVVTLGGLMLIPRASTGPGDPSPTEPPAQVVWPGPIRPQVGRLPVIALPIDDDGLFRWADVRDAPISAVDISSVATDSPEQPHWRIHLREWPPQAAGLDPAVTLISYGLVFDTTGDGLGDYVVGINNDAPKPGEFRVWVTDVATGRTDEQIGPPYGAPIEFSHPDELRGGDVPPPAEPSVIFTFLGGSAPPGLDADTPFYAWTSMTAGEDVVAWDYAPDGSWAKADYGLTLEAPPGD